MINTRLQAPGLARAFTEEEIRKIRGASELGAVDIELTLRCNLSCKYCYAEAGKKRRDELSIDEITRVIDSACDMGAKVLNLTGGEPLLHDGFFVIAEYGRSRGLDVICFTNGTLITREVADRMYQLQISPCVKLDAMTPQVQDLLAGVNGTHSKILGALSHLAASGYCRDLPSLSINAVACMPNHEEVPTVWRWARERGMTPSVSRTHPFGRAGANRDLLLTTRQIRVLFERLALVDREFGEIWDPIIPWVCGRACRRYYVGCFVNSEGGVQACSELPISLGNIRKDGLSHILQSSTEVRICRNIEDHVKGACGGCRHKERCYGCRALAFNFSGDYLGADPLCWNNPEAF